MEDALIYGRTELTHWCLCHQQWCQSKTRVTVNNEKVTVSPKEVTVISLSNAKMCAPSPLSGRRIFIASPI